MWCLKVKTQLSHLGILCENYPKYNFRQCHLLNPTGILFNSPKAEPFPYNKETPLVSSTAPVINILSVSFGPGAGHIQFSTPFM